MRVAFDHHFTPRVAAILRQVGLDAVAAAEVGLGGDDEELLTLCWETGRTLITNNAADFELLARRWQGQGRSHHGLVFSSYASMPRTDESVARYAESVAALMRAHPGDADFVDVIHWL